MTLLPYYRPIFKRRCQFPLKLDVPVEAPTVPGVYFITEYFMGEEVIVYIGSSRHLRSRLYSHHIILKLKKLKTYAGLYIIPLKISEYKDDEKSYIREITPKYNIHLYSKK